MEEEAFLEAYPYDPKPADHSRKRYRVHYDLGFERGGQWDAYYRTLVGAHLAILWNHAWTNYRGKALIFVRKTK